MTALTPVLFLRQACRSDIDTIYRWRAETVAWLAERHPDTDQWSRPYPRSNLERWVDRGETFMATLVPGGDPVGTITTSSEGDPELWTPFQRATPARYVSKLNVDRRLAGLGLGVSLMHWAFNDAVDAGAALVRIDVWSTNTALHDFYRRLGFQYLHTVPGTVSGALFETPARRVEGVPVVGPPLAPDCQVAVG